MATFTSQINGNDIYAKRAEATRKGVNLETYGEGAGQVKGILPAGLVPGAEGTNDANILATQQYVLTQMAGVAEALIFKGTIGAADDDPTVTELPADHKTGWTYKVATAGTYADKACEIGDMIICVKTGTVAAAADWTVVQNNIDGAVTGPVSGSVVDGELAAYNATTGKVIKGTGILASNVKTKQTAVSDPTASGSGLDFISNASQNANGEITVAKKTVQDGTTSQKGVVQLAGSIDATVASENNKAATEKAVRDAINDLDVNAVTVGASKTLVSISEEDGKISTSAVDIQIAESQVTNLVDDLASKQDNLSFEGTYDASTNKVATESTVSDAINALDVSAISVGADKTLTSISETDGKISATPVAIQIAESQVTNLTTDLAAKANKVASATNGNFAGLDSNGDLTDSGSKAADFATAAQGDKADSAIQGVSIANGTATPTPLTPDANNVVTVPVATTSTYGVVTIGTINIE